MAAHTIPNFPTRKLAPLSNDDSQPQDPTTDYVSLATNWLHTSKKIAVLSEWGKGMLSFGANRAPSVFPGDSAVSRCEVLQFDLKKK